MGNVGKTDHMTVAQLRAVARASGMSAAEFYRQSLDSASARTSAGSSSRTLASLRRV